MFYRIQYLSKGQRVPGYGDLPDGTTPQAVWGGGAKQYPEPVPYARLGGADIVEAVTEKAALEAFMEQSGGRITPGEYVVELLSTYTVKDRNQSII